jgi:hypothetical protein
MPPLPQVLAGRQHFATLGLPIVRSAVLGFILINPSMRLCLVPRPDQSIAAAVFGATENRGLLQVAAKSEAHLAARIMLLGYAIP